MNVSLFELEQQLKTLSHDQEALEIIRRFSEQLGKTAKRQEVFNAPGALVRDPILYPDVLARGLFPPEPEEDAFTLLQGDVVITESGYLLGERIEGRAKFVIVTSTCDLVPQRRKFGLLLRVKPLRADDERVRSDLNNLLRFQSTRAMYIPAFPDDDADVVANAIDLDGIVQIRLEDLLLATRVASMSLVGWRMFGSMLRSILVRTGETETNMRVSLEQ